MRKVFYSTLIIAMLLAGCQNATASSKGAKKTIVVTYSILGALVKDLVGDKANVVVLIPNGQDPHEWEPSAKAIETLMNADLIVQNGLGLEGGLEKTLSQAAAAGVKSFIATDHINVRRVGLGEGIPKGGTDQTVGAPDPHIWTDPLTMKLVTSALSDQLKTDLGLDVTVQAKDQQSSLDSLNIGITKMVDTLPADNRKLVTGHESLGYFAQRYGLKLIGAVVPSLNSQAEVSAADMSALKTAIAENKVKAIFSEIGTPTSISNAISTETGVKVVDLATHFLPSDGSYYTFMNDLAQTIVENLR